MKKTCYKKCKDLKKKKERERGKKRHFFAFSDAPSIHFPGLLINVCLNKTW